MWFTMDRACHDVQYDHLLLCWCMLSSKDEFVCRFAKMKYDQELPSKLLYQWVQKKGRTVNKTIQKYELPENEEKEVVINFFRSLNPELPEASRIAFTCKFMQTQFGVTIQSKQFYNMLNEKGKKLVKRY